MAMMTADFESPAQLKFFSAEADQNLPQDWDNAAEFGTLKEAIGVAIGRSSFPGHSACIRTRAGHLLGRESINDLWWQLNTA